MGAPELAEWQGGCGLRVSGMKVVHLEPGQHLMNVLTLLITTLAAA